MARSQPVQPVKLLVAVLWADAEARDQALERLAREWGSLDFQGADIPFDLTDYYVPEMGTNLQRRLVTFRKLVPPEDLRAAKLRCNELEEELSGPRGRRVNLDIGYLDHNKIVLASLKYAGQKIHLGDGIFADLIARYRGGRYCPFEWTFPDFSDGRYDDQLAVIRRSYLTALREERR